MRRFAFLRSAVRSAAVLVVSTLGFAFGPLVAPAAAGGGLAACPHGFSCTPVEATRYGHVGNPDGRPYLRTDPYYLAFPQRRVVVVPGHRVKRHKVRRAKRHRVVRGRTLHTRRYGRVSLHGRTKFCSDHVAWKGRHGVRRCVWVLNSLLDTRGYRLERRGYRKH